MFKVLHVPLERETSVYIWIFWEQEFWFKIQKNWWYRNGRKPQSASLVNDGSFCSLLLPFSMRLPLSIFILSSSPHEAIYGKRKVSWCHSRKILRILPFWCSIYSPLIPAIDNWSEVTEMAGNRETFLILLCSILFVVVPLAHGWGKEGHYIICRIAQVCMGL